MSFQEIATRARASWARLIKKVYEVDPLECPKCKGPMRVIALINDASVVQCSPENCHQVCDKVID
ncbi:MAG: hypothetical protein HYU44_10430 [Betaproteobacteria bacterium]|nr:hypothetical protein [Betaproteobacteria bacterium]